MLVKPLFSLLLVTTLVFANDIEDDLSGFSEETSVEQINELDGFSDEDEALDGFADEEVVLEKKITKEEQNFVLSGNMAFKTSVGYKKHEVDGSEYSGINQAQSSLYLQVDGKLSDNWKLRVSGDAFYDAIYDLRSNENYAQEVKDDYRTQLRLDDTYVQGSITSDLDLKVGRQLVVWGKSDNIRITDVINPLDNRLPGMTDIEDLRLSVGMAKFDYYVGAWNVSAMIILENRIFYEATPRGEYFPVDKVFFNAPNPFPDLQTPATSWDNIQYALAVNGVFSGWDISFYAADVLDSKWHLDRAVGTPITSETKRRVSKVKMLGTAANVVYGSWLLKAEMAFFEGIKYNNTNDDKNRFDSLVGLEYMGIKDTTFSLEVANRHIFDYEKQMAIQADFVDMNEMQTALRVTRSFMNDSFNATALLSMFGSSWENGGFFRMWGEYELMEAVNLNVGIVDYIGGDKPLMEAVKDNDRVFADIRFSF